MSRTVSRQFGSSSAVQQSSNSGFTVEEKIWENPDTTAEFGETTINLNLSKYDAIRLLTIGDNSSNNKIYINSICLKGERTSFRINSSNGTNLAWLEREVEVGESSVLITACTRKTQGSSSIATVNNLQIPSVIYGVRFSSAPGSGGVDVGSGVVAFLTTFSPGSRTLNAHTGYTLGDIPLDIPNGYSLIANVNISAFGFPGLVPSFDSSNGSAYFSKSPTCYAYNASSSNRNLNTATIFIISLCKKG